MPMVVGHTVGSGVPTATEYRRAVGRSTALVVYAYPLFSGSVERVDQLWRRVHAGRCLHPLLYMGAPPCALCSGGLLCLGSWSARSAKWGQRFLQRSQSSAWT